MPLYGCVYFYDIVYFRVIRDISRELGGEHLKWRTGALEAIHCGAESFLVKLMENSNYAAIHAGRVTLQAKDIQLVMRILDVKDMFKTDTPVTGLKKTHTVTEDDRKKQLKILKESTLKRRKRVYSHSESDDSEPTSTRSGKKKKNADTSSSEGTTQGKRGDKGKPKRKSAKKKRDEESSSSDGSSDGKVKPKSRREKEKRDDKSKQKTANEKRDEKSKGKTASEKKDKWTEKPAPKKNVGKDGDKSNTEDEAKDGKKSKGKGVREKNKNRKDEDKWKGKVSGKTGTKSSRNTRKGKKDDGEKSESAQQERIQPGTSQNSSQSDKKGKLEKDEPILHIGGNEIPPYACGICKNRFFLPRSLLCHIEQAHKRKESSSDSESDEPQLAKIKPLKSGHPSRKKLHRK